MPDLILNSVLLFLGHLNPHPHLNVLYKLMMENSKTPPTYCYNIYSCIGRVLRTDYLR